MTSICRVIRIGKINETLPVCEDGHKNISLRQHESIFRVKSRNDQEPTQEQRRVICRKQGTMCRSARRMCQRKKTKSRLFILKTTALVTEIRLQESAKIKAQRSKSRDQSKFKVQSELFPHFALCTLRFALCALRFALCTLRFALTALPVAA